MRALLFVVALSLLAAACGVKTDLTRPNGPPTTRDDDPSRPPHPLGE